MQPRIMKDEWGDRAKLNPMHSIASTKVVWDEKEFFGVGRRKSRDTLSPISRRSAVVEKRRRCGCWRSGTESAE
jgi:hypothetical protein